MGRQALIVVKYMIKGYIVNPILRRRVYRFALALIALSVIIVLIAPLLLVGGNVEQAQDRQKEQGNAEGIAKGLRTYILSIGLDKNSIIDIGSLAVLLIIVYSLLYGRHKIIVDEAEYELVLSQPISMQTYIASRVLYSIVRGLIYMPLFFIYVPLCLELNNGNAKAFIAPISFTLVLYVFGAIGMSTVTMVNNMLSKLGYRKYLYIGLTVYLVIGLIHSFETKYISPLLTTPFRSLMELLVYPSTISETMADILASLCKTLVVLMLMFTLTLRLSKYVDPEDLAPLERVMAGKRVEILRKTRKPLIVSKSPSTTVRLFIFKRSIMNPNHIRNLLIALTITVTVSLVVKTLVPVNLLPLTLLATSMLPAIIIASMFASTIQFTLSEDICAYWIYRVYLIEMKSVAESMLAKYVVYLTELLLITATANTVLTSNILHLLYPLTALPSSIVTGFLILATLSYFMSKKKIIKHLPTGIDVLEELVSGIIWCTVIVSTTSSLISFSILLACPPLIIIVSVASLILTPPLYILLAKILSKIMQTTDIIT